MTIFQIFRGINYYLIIHFLLISSAGFSVTAIGQDDQIASSSLILRIKQAFHNTLENSLDSLEPTQRVSLIRAYEKQLDNISSKISRVEYLDEKIEIAWRYMNAYDFQGAKQAYENIAQMEPNSKYAARAYLNRAWITAFNERQYSLAVPELKKSLEISEQLRKVPVDEFYDREVSGLTGSALSTLGDLYFYLGRSDESIEVFEYLLSQPDVVQVASEAQLRNANSSLGRRLSEKGEFERAVHYFRATDKLAQASTTLPLNMKIGYAMEFFDALGETKELSEQERILYLKELWMAYRDHKSIDALRVGNTLALSYFFSEEAELRKKFWAFANELQDFTAELRQSKGINENDWLTIYSITQQISLLQAELA